MAPDEVAALLAPLVAPYPCDVELAREYVLEGADAQRRRELDAVPGALDAMACGVVDTVAQGLAGLTHDLALQVTPPDLELGDVVCPVHLWYGTLDRSAPPSFGHWFAAHLPDAPARDRRGRRAYLLLLPRWAAIVRGAFRLTLTG